MEQATISPSRMRALKRQRDYSYSPEASSELPPGPHAPAKPEGRVLRRLCSQTGLAPDEVRQHKAHRRELSAAQSTAGSRPQGWRTAFRLRKRIVRETGHQPWTPEFREAFLKAWSVYSIWRHPRLARQDAEVALQLALLPPGRVPA